MAPQRKPDSVAELRARLAEAEAALEAIRSGAADALIDASGDVLHRKGSEKPYLTYFGAMNEGGVTLDDAGAILLGNPRFVGMIGRPIEELRGARFVSCLVPEDRAAVASLLAGDAVAACEALLDAADGPMPVHLSVKTVDVGRQRFHCMVITDLSDRARAEAELRAAITRHRETEAQLRQRERDLRSILDHVPSMIGYWDAGLCNRFGNYAYRNWFGIDPDQMSGKHIREVIGESNYRFDLPHIEATLRGEYQVFEGAVPLPDGKGTRHSLAHYIPDVVDGQVQGFYALVTDITAAKEGEAAIRDSEERLRAMYANLQAMVEAERKHVAREIHDELGQVLTALRMETSLLQHDLRGAEGAAVRIDEMRRLIESMFRTVRSIAGNLRPSTLDLGLVPAIEWLAEDFEKRWHIDCALDVDPRDIEASDAYATTVFRVIQESLTNVARHARATSVSISLRQWQDRMHLEIHDNGCGFEYDGDRMRGFGMVGMRERILELGGDMTVESGVDKGTCIVIGLPLVSTSVK